MEVSLLNTTKHKADQKASLRAELLKKRAIISPVEKIAVNISAAFSLLKVIQQRQAKLQNLKLKVGLYKSIKHELPTIFAIELLQQDASVDIFLPKVKGERLVFNKLTANATFNKNQFSIDEIQSEDDYQIYDLDLIVLPLVGFDEMLNRLGMGGGFYDRAFNSCPKDKKPLACGYAFEKQKVANIPYERLDYPLDLIITEQKIYYNPSQQQIL